MVYVSGIHGTEVANGMGNRNRAIVSICHLFCGKLHISDTCLICKAAYHTSVHNLPHMSVCPCYAPSWWRKRLLSLSFLGWWWGAMGSSEEPKSWTLWLSILHTLFPPSQTSWVCRTYPRKREHGVFLFCLPKELIFKCFPELRPQN